MLSFLVFGLIPPATYGYAFEQMNDQNLTLGAVAIASLLCIIILASCKAYIMKSDKLSMYFKTIMYYVCIALMVSGISYEAGDLINKLMENYGWFEKTSAFPLSLPGASSRNPVPWTSYWRCCGRFLSSTEFVCFVLCVWNEDISQLFFDWLLWLLFIQSLSKHIIKKK